MGTIARQAGKGKDLSPDDLYAYFVERTKQNLHIVLCMSPIGDAFRDRIRKFPSLVNCCTVDWFQSWPSDALTAVANKSVREIGEAIPQELVPGLVDLAMHFHQSVRSQSEKFRDQLRRYNYVTPTSYLELLTQYQKSLGIKQKEVRSVLRLDHQSSQLGCVML